MPNRRCKFPMIYCARSLEIPFLPRAHRRDLKADCPHYCGQKISRAEDRRPRARPRAWLLPPAAESFYLTELRKFLVDFLNSRPPAAQQIETAMRGWRVITAPCDASAVRRRRRLWRLCPASNRGCLSYLDQDFVFRSF